MIPGQHVPQSVRQAQYPLAHGDDREDVINQVRGALGHASPAATGTDRATLARERHQAVQTTLAAVEARKPAREKAALQKFPKLLLYESRQGVALADAGRFGQETSQCDHA